MSTINFITKSPFLTNNIIQVQENIIDEAKHFVKEKEADDEFIDSRIRSLGNVTFEELHGNAKESPYDTESEIKIVKRFNLQHSNDEHIKFMGPVYSDMEDDTEAQSDGINITLTNSSKDARVQEADSDLESMHGDEIESVSGFKTTKTEDDDTQSQHKEELSNFEEMATDNVLDELADMANSKNAKINSFAKKPSLLDPLGHLRKDLSSLTSRVEHLESSLAQQVANKIEDSMPRLVANAFEERIPDLLSNTLKNILPQIIKDSIKQALYKFDKKVKKILNVEIPELLIRPLNNAFNLLNKKERSRFDSLQNSLAKTIKIKVGKYVMRSVRKEVTVVHEILRYCVTQLDKNDVNLYELVNLIRDLVVLLDSSLASTKATPKRDKLSTQENMDLEIIGPAPAKAEQ
ncbi:hypothetical protein Tco_0672685 [Tanacetum coccineum]